MTYPEALAYISSLAPRGWRLGLDRMQELLVRAELSSCVGGQTGPKFVHVTGTNGKGSVTAFLQSLLVQQGHRTGAFYSPFVYTPRERVQFGRDMISEGELATLTEALMAPAESLTGTELGGATEFEFKTALGFKYWCEKNCDWVALEVGLGGRLDATNVVQPAASVIVSIALDHTNVLGNSIEEIAYEKAGIIKSGVPIIIGSVPHEARTVIERTAAERGSPVWRFGHEFDLLETPRGYSVRTPTKLYENLYPSLVGVKQPHNMALAVAAMDAAGAVRDAEMVDLGVARARLPGRMERRIVEGIEFLLDGAHNPAASTVLRENLDTYFPGRRTILVSGMVAGHDPRHFYAPLKGRIGKGISVPIQFHRALPADEVGGAMKESFEMVCIADTLQEGLAMALAEAGADDLVVVTGSFYLVGEAGSILDASIAI